MVKVRIILIAVVISSVFLTVLVNIVVTYAILFL